MMVRLYTIYGIKILKASTLIRQLECDDERYTLQCIINMDGCKNEMNRALGHLCAHIG